MPPPFARLFEPRVAWAAVAALILAITTLSLVPDPRELIDVDLWDKLSHFLAYGALALALGHALGLERPLQRAAPLAIAASAAYGAAIEFAQVLVPQRTGTALDALANLIGAIAGGLLAAGWLWAARRVRRGDDSTTPPGTPRLL